MNILCLGDDNVEGLLGNSFKIFRRYARHPELLIDQTITKVCTSPFFTLFLNDSGQLFMVENFKLRPINSGEYLRDVVCGNSFYATLNTKGEVKVYGLKYLGSTSESMNYSALEEATTFEEFENEAVTQIGCNNKCIYFLTETGNLYEKKSIRNRVVRRVQESETTTSGLSKVQIEEKVERIFVGEDSIFVITQDKKLMSWGSNDGGLLGNSLSEKYSSPRVINIPIQTDEIKEIKSSELTTVILSKKQVLYEAGRLLNSSYYSTKVNFSICRQFQNQKVLAVGCKARSIMVFTERKELWCISTMHQLMETLCKKSIGSLFLIQTNMQAKTDQIYMNKFGHTFLLISREGLSKDFLQLFQSGEFSDFEVSKIKCHKQMIQFRTGQDPETVKKYLEDNFNYDEIYSFFFWLYGGQSPKLHYIVKIAENLGFTLKDKIFNHDIAKLLKDEESKDFTLKVIEENYDDEEDEFEEEIPVHKLILLARSGLFREMFKNINEKETNSVKDYSGKTVESIEKLIEFFYLDTFTLTADDDPQLIVEELQDAIDYYQLKNSSNLKFLLGSIKAQFSNK
ncbi:rcc1-like g exchanging factor-like protein [Anaeramoeba flamelloides]|uniref:Rcc1-like g exchanging factor-like protein n=1 Tax=Anaeramoeba flamelloides TaxID=1746091 RepID=A0AAV7YZG0_9EUKA|nr:rcc1-like g exchanging factor-like protein [Anaeramoeba flamelloides]